jgi:hypothetical protein
MGFGGTCFCNAESQCVFDATMHGIAPLLPVVLIGGFAFS